jgi:hypothetical protein
MAVFISYRREDTAGETGRLYDHLVNRYGDDDVFRDIDAIRPGTNFVKRIGDVIESANAVVAVIGRDWLTSTDSSGRRRLDNPKDFVRVELAAALEKGTLLIPVLVQEANMPSEDDLPEALKPLASIHALEITEARWTYDVGRLVQVLDAETDLPAGRKPDSPLERPNEAATVVSPPLEADQKRTIPRPAKRRPRVPGEPPPRMPPGLGTKQLVGIGLVIAAAAGVGLFFGLRDGGDGSGPSVRSPTASPSVPRPVASRLDVDQIEATGTDAEVDEDACTPPNDVTFQPRNMLDQEPNTAWRTKGDGLGERVTIVLDGPHRVTELGLIPGYAKVDPCTGDKRFPQNRTISQVMLRFDDGTSVTAEFKPRPDLQPIELDVETQTIIIEILRTAPPTARPPTENLGGNTAISEIEVYGLP